MLPDDQAIVLSEVPPRKAGARSGVLATTQQSALALGLARSAASTWCSPPARARAAQAILGVLVLNALEAGAISRELEGRGAAWIEERGACDERRGTAVPQGRPAGEREPSRGLPGPRG